MGTVRDLIQRHGAWGELTALADDWFMWCVPLEAVDAVRREFEFQSPAR